MASQVDIAAYLGVSAAAVSKIARVLGFDFRGKGVDQREFIAAWFRHLAEQAAGRMGASGGGDLVRERARESKERADKIARENAVAMGKLIPDDDHREALTDAFARVRAKMLALPSRAAPQVAELTRPTEVQERLEAIVHEALAELAATEVDEPPE